MNFEYTEMWEIVIPGYIPYKVWYDKISHLITGHMIFNSEIKGYWKSIPEDSRVFRIAADEQTMKWIAEITADNFEQECVMFYKISSTCILAKRE